MASLSGTTPWAYRAGGGMRAWKSAAGPAWALRLGSGHEGGGELRTNCCPASACSVVAPERGEHGVRRGHGHGAPAAVTVLPRVHTAVTATWCGAQVPLHLRYCSYRGPGSSETANRFTPLLVPFLFSPLAFIRPIITSYSRLLSPFAGLCVVVWRSPCLFNWPA